MATHAHICEDCQAYLKAQASHDQLRARTSDMADKVSQLHGEFVERTQVGRKAQLIRSQNEIRQAKREMDAQMQHHRTEVANLRNELSVSNARADKMHLQAMEAVSTAVKAVNQSSTSAAARPADIRVGGASLNMKDLREKWSL